MSLNPVSAKHQVTNYEQLTKMEVKRQVARAVQNVSAKERESYSAQIMGRLKQQFPTWEERLEHILPIAESIIDQPLVDDGGAPLDHSIKPLTQLIVHTLSRSKSACTLEGNDWDRLHQRLEQCSSDELLELGRFVNAHCTTSLIDGSTFQTMLKGFTRSVHTECRPYVSDHVPVDSVAQLIEGYAYPDFLNFTIKNEELFTSSKNQAIDAEIFINISLSGALEHLRDPSGLEVELQKKHDLLKVSADYYRAALVENRPSTSETIIKTIRQLSDATLFEQAQFFLDSATLRIVEYAEFVFGGLIMLCAAHNAQSDEAKEVG